MVPGEYLWFFMVTGWYFMVPAGFFIVPAGFYSLSWFQVGFAWFQVDFHGFSSSRLAFHGSSMVFHSSGWVFMVVHGSRLIFSLFQVGFHGLSSFQVIERRSPPRHSPPQTFTTPYSKMQHSPPTNIHHQPTFTTPFNHHPQKKNSPTLHLAPGQKSAVQAVVDDI